MYYPIMIDLSKFQVVMVGGGNVAARKAMHLLNCRAKLTIISLTLCEALEKKKDYFRYYKKTYETQDLEGYQMVIAATSDKVCNWKIGTYCKEKGILCNVATDERLSSFIVPSVVRRGDLVLSVSTGGKSPALTRKIKDELENQYDDTYAEYVALLGELRQMILNKMEPGPKRVELLRKLTEMDLTALREYGIVLKKDFATILSL